jgi:hypothetical protein
VHNQANPDNNKRHQARWSKIKEQKGDSNTIQHTHGELSIIKRKHKNSERNAEKQGKTSKIKHTGETLSHKIKRNHGKTRKI